MPRILRILRMNESEYIAHKRGEFKELINKLKNSSAFSEVFKEELAEIERSLNKRRHRQK